MCGGGGGFLDPPLDMITNVYVFVYMDIYFVVVFCFAIIKTYLCVHRGYFVPYLIY